MRLGAAALVGALAASTASGAPELSLPLDCTPGESCFVQNYVDRDPGPDALDFTCGPLTYDGHKGTDIALTSLAAMQAGVAVRAAADGIVTGMRDGMADRIMTAENADQIKGRECGNGLVIDHGDGWVTQYCHMQRGSLTIQQGQSVKSGDLLGLVGLSGQTQFPHLELSVRLDGAVVDPFAPGAGATCGGSGTPLWKNPIAYAPGGLIALGFTDAIPAFDAVKSGTVARETLPPDAPALVLFAYGYGSRAGDQLDITIQGPAKRVMARTVRLEKTQAQYFRAIGKRAAPGGWPAGRYTGTVALIRQGRPIGRQTIELTIQ